MSGTQHRQTFAGLPTRDQDLLEGATVAILGASARPGRCRAVLRGHASDPQLLGTGNRCSISAATRTA